MRLSCAVQRGGERYAESNGTSASAASAHNKANIPLLDLLKCRLPKDSPAALELAGLELMADSGRVHLLPAGEGPSLPLINEGES